MVKPVTRYEARDGSIHETEYEAQGREALIDLTERIEEEFGHTLHGTSSRDIAQFIAGRFNVGEPTAFMYFENEEGGMSVHDFERGDVPSNLVGWMDKDCKKGDTKLVNWLNNARVGDVFHHRLGVCVCVSKKQAARS